MENKKGSKLKDRIKDEGFGVIKKDAKQHEKPVIEIEYVTEKGK